MNNPVVSVCIANFNGISIVSSCLNSVLAQQGNVSTEIILHDDASTDGSVEFLRKHYPDITLITSEKNVGFCVANNRMAAIAKGEYLLLLNNDAMLFPDALTSLLNKAEEIGSPAILGLPQYDADTNELLDRGSLLDPFLNPIPNLDTSRAQVGMVMGACMWIPKELWVELGGFPEWFGSIGEDLYLCCHARLKGHEVMIANASGYLHKVGHSFGGGKVKDSRLVTSRRRRAFSERNKTYAMLVTYPLPLLLLVFPLHILLLLVEGGALSLLKRDWLVLNDIYLNVLISVWRGRVLLLNLRREVQRSKRCSMWYFLSVFRWTPYKLSMFIRYGLPLIRH